MAMKVSSNIEENKQGIKVEGELSDFQILEENTCEDDPKDIGSSVALSSIGNIGKVADIPSSLIKASSSPICGNVAVSNSENVVIGNHTYFNGPVVIKQVIQSTSGLDNPSYIASDDDSTSAKRQRQDCKDTTIKRFHLQKWHKITFSAVCLIVLGGVFAILSIILSKSNQDNTSLGVNDEETTSESTPLIIAPDHLRIVSRTDWLAQPVDSKLLDKIRQPVPWVIISHTATEGCTTQSECVLRVRIIQTFHIESRDWDDIGYNFLVAGDGSAYYGRGWDYIGAHTLGYNRFSIGISFVGTFNTEPPPQKQLDACQKLIKRGVALGKLAKDYKLFAHRQLASTLSPGDKLYDIIKEWPHFVKNITDISELLPDY